MTARVGYLTALAAGRPAGPLLRPARRLFPSLTLADAGYASPEPLAAAGPEATTGPRLTSHDSPPSAARRETRAGPAEQPGITPPRAAVGRSAAPEPDEPPGPSYPTSTPPANGHPGAAPNGHPGAAPNVRPGAAATGPADVRASQAPAGSRMAGSRTTNSGAAKRARSGARVAEQVEATPPPAASGWSSATGLAEPPVSGHPTDITARTQAPSAAPTEAPSAAPTGTADQAGSTGWSADGTWTARGPAADPPGPPGPSGPSRSFGLSAVRSRREAAGAAEPGAASPGYPGAQVKRDRSPVGQAGPVDHAGPTGREGPAGRAGPADRAGSASRKELTERAAATVAQAEQAERAERAVSRPAPTAPPAGSPDTRITGLPPRRREEAPTSGERATLSIGTVEITVLPPREQKSPAPPAPRRAAPAGPPERLSRGLGPWFGRGQA